MNMAPEFLMVVVVILYLVLFLGIMALWIRTARIDRFLTTVDQKLGQIGQAGDRIERTIREEQSRTREESLNQSRFLREEVGSNIKGINDTLVRTMTEISHLQKDQLDTFSGQLDQFSQAQGNRLADVVHQVGEMTAANERRQEQLRALVESKLDELRIDNAGKLEQMRQTVDEKLQGTLEKRLGESFVLVSQQLENVYKSIGEMQSLATSVGDLKKVLSNVKSRGTWGEIQLGNLLGQIMTPDQLLANAEIKPGSGQRVEFAIKLPGRGDQDVGVLLPIDAKFPQEDYDRLVDASEQGDKEAVEMASRAIEGRIRASAREIHEKYIHPPFSTDFGILFLPTEGLFAEVIRRPGLAETIQRESRVVLTGPTTLMALLNSLQMGFRTLAIEKRSSEVWQVLAAVKTEFGKYGEILSKVQEKLQQASNTLDKVNVRRRAIESRLRGVESLPDSESKLLLGLPASSASHEDEERVEP